MTRVAACLLPLFVGVGCRCTDGSAGGDRTVLTVVAVGDTSHPTTLSGAKDFAGLGRRMFAPTRPYIVDADLAFLNLETPLTDLPPTAKKRIVFTTHPSEIDHLLWTGFDLLSLANNHVLDAGKKGLRQTLKVLEAARQGLPDGRMLVWAGAGRTAKEARRAARFQAKGLSIVFLAYSFGKSKLLNRYKPSRVVRDVKAASGADLIVVSVHTGPEYEHVPRKSKVRAFRRFADAGAHLVLGTHPHVFQPVEVRGDSVIFYSLGNYAFGTNTKRNLAKKAEMLSPIGRVTFVRERGRSRPTEVVIHPLFVGNRFPLEVGERTHPPVRYIPEVLTGEFAAYANRRFLEWTEKVKGVTSRFEEEEGTLVWRRSPDG